MHRCIIQPVDVTVWPPFWQVNRNPDLEPHTRGLHQLITRLVDETLGTASISLPLVRLPLKQRTEGMTWLIIRPFHDIVGTLLCGPSFALQRLAPAYKLTAHVDGEGECTTLSCPCCTSSDRNKSLKNEHMIRYWHFPKV